MRRRFGIDVDFLSPGLWQLFAFFQIDIPETFQDCNAKSYPFRLPPSLPFIFAPELQLLIGIRKTVDSTS